jgi:hypothetical protein
MFALRATAPWVRACRDDRKQRSRVSVRKPSEPLFYLTLALRILRKRVEAGCFIYAQHDIHVLNGLT